MDMQKLQLHIDEIDYHISELSKSVAQLKIQCKELQEDNNKLRIHNADLRDKMLPIFEKIIDVDRYKEEEVAKGLDNLQTFYHEGIHVCHEFFGSRLLPDEQCLFCQEVMKRLN